MRRVAWQQFDNELFAALRNNRFLRDHTRSFPHTKHGIDPRKHARTQLQLAVVDAAPNPDRAAIGLNQRVNRLNFCSELAARQRVHVEHGGLPAFDFGLKTFRQPEVNKHRVHVFDVDDVSTVFQVVAHIDQPNACDAVKRRSDLQSRCGCLRQDQLGACHLQICCAFVQRPLADEILCHQFLVAFLIGLGNGHFSQRLLDLRLRQLVVKLNQQLPFFYPLAIGEIKLSDAPTDFRPQHHAPTGPQTADGLCVVGQARNFNLGHFHRRRSAASGATGSRLGRTGSLARRSN